MFLRNIFQQYRYRLLCLASRQCKVNHMQWESSKAATKATEKDQPVPFLTSEAGQWKALYSIVGDRAIQNRPKSEPMTILISLTIFMIYFLVLREENDLDDWVREIENTVPIQVEEYQLRTTITEGIKHGQDVRDLKIKLAELMERKKNAKAK